MKLMVFFRTPPAPWQAATVPWRSETPWLMPDGRPLRLERERCLPLSAGDAVEPYRAVESTWWPDLASFERAWAHRITSTAWADALPIDAMLAEEVVALPPASGF